MNPLGTEERPGLWVLPKQENSELRGGIRVDSARFGCTPVLVAGTRAYAFTGNGTFGGQLAASACPTTFGGPNGIRTRVYSPPRASCVELRTSRMSTQQRLSGDLNSGDKCKVW